MGRHRGLKTNFLGYTYSNGNSDVETVKQIDTDALEFIKSLVKAVRVKENVSRNAQYCIYYRVIPVGTVPSDPWLSPGFGSKYAYPPTSSPSTQVLVGLVLELKHEVEVPLARPATAMSLTRDSLSC